MKLRKVYVLVILITGLAVMGGCAGARQSASTPDADPAVTSPLPATGLPAEPTSVDAASTPVAAEATSTPAPATAEAAQAEQPASQTGGATFLPAMPGGGEPVGYTAHPKLAEQAATQVREPVERPKAGEVTIVPPEPNLSLITAELTDTKPGEVDSDSMRIRVKVISSKPVGRYADLVAEHIGSLLPLSMATSMFGDLEIGDTITAYVSYRSAGDGDFWVEMIVE